MYVKHLLADPEKITTFSTDGAFILFVNRIAVENFDKDFVLDDKEMCIDYIRNYCPNLELVLSPLESLRLAIDEESVNIYFDNGFNKEPTHLVYWHIDEVVEDSTVAISIANAIQLFYTNPQKLIDQVGIS